MTGHSAGVPVAATSPMLSLTGHHALVTGSTKGVGLAIAQSLARAGANVLLHCRKDGPEAQQALEGGAWLDVLFAENVTVQRMSR